MTHLIGTTGTKTVLVDTDGKVKASAYEEYGVLNPHPGWAEQWPDVWVQATIKTIRRTIEQSRIDPRDIAGACISSLCTIGWGASPLKAYSTWDNARVHMLYSKSFSIIMRLTAAREGRIIVVMNESTPKTKPAAMALIHSTI